MPLSLRPHLLSKYLTQTFMSHGNELICQPVTLSGYAEWPKVADAVIEASARAERQYRAHSRTLSRPDRAAESCGSLPGESQRAWPSRRSVAVGRLPQNRPDSHFPAGPQG